MGRPSRIIFFVLFTAGGILALELPARADPSLGMAWAGYPTVTVGLKTLGIGSLIVVAIEALVIRAIAGLPWKGSFVASLDINIASTIVGLVAWWIISVTGIFSICCFLLLGIGVFFWFMRRKSWLFALLVPIGIIVGLWGMRNMNDIPWASTWAIWACILYQILLGFGLSLGSEIFFAARFIPRKAIVKTIFLANVASYIFIVLAAPFYWPNPVVQRYSYEKRGIEEGWIAGRPRLYGPRDADAETVFLPYYRMNLSTSQLLGISEVVPPIAMTDEETFIDFILHGAFQRSYWRDEKGSRNNVLEFIELSFLNFELSDDASRVLKWVKITVESWPDIFKAVEENRADDFRNLFAEWKQKEEEIRLDNPPVMMSSITTGSYYQQRDEPFTEYANDWVSPILYFMHEMHGTTPGIIKAATELSDEYGYYYKYTPERLENYY